MPTGGVIGIAAGGGLLLVLVVVVAVLVHKGRPQRGDSYVTAETGSSGRLTPPGAGEGTARQEPQGQPRGTGRGGVYTINVQSRVHPEEVKV